MTATGLSLINSVPGYASAGVSINVPPGTGSDTDSDGVPDAVDNCASVANPTQADRDADGLGDACDTCTDLDSDAVGDAGFTNTACPISNGPDNCTFAPNPALFRHFIEEARGQAGSIYGRQMYELMRYWDDEHPEWDAPEREFAAAWRKQPKWVVSRSLTSVGPNATLVGGDLEGAIRKL